MLAPRRHLSDIGQCAGLYVSSKDEDESGDPDDYIMEDGIMSDNWNGQQVNMATPDEEVREFYIWKHGKPIFFDNVTVRSANPQFNAKGLIIKPSLDNDGEQSISAGVSTQGPVNDNNLSYTAHLRYGRCFRFGQPYVWITFEAWRTRTGGKKPKGYDLLKACGIDRSQCKGKVCLRFTVLWAKQCPPQRAPMNGFTVGTSTNSQDVVVNGQTMPDFDENAPAYYITKDTTRSVFYIFLQKGSDPVTIGKPSVQGFADNQLMITQSGSAGRGLQLSSDGNKATLEINFQCKPGQEASEQRISVGVDICQGDTMPNDCTLQASSLISYQPVKFSFIKYCLRNPGHRWGYILFTLLLCLTVFGCVLGCVYKYRVEGARQLEIIPGIEGLRVFVAALQGTPMFQSCPCPQFRRPKYETVSQLDDDEGEPGDGLVNSSVSYQGNAADAGAAATIALPRYNLDADDDDDAEIDVEDVLPEDDDDLEDFYAQ